METRQVQFDNQQPLQATVRFDETTGYVKFNEKWKSGQFVNSQTVGYTDENGTSTRIDRTSGQLSITHQTGRSIATGAYEVASQLPKKF